MNIHVIVIGYALANEVGNLLMAFSGPDITRHLFLHKGNGLVEDVFNHAERSGTPTVLHRYRTNRGLARSWNDGLEDAYKMGADVAILVNDDMLATREDLNLLAQAALDQRDCGVVAALGYDSNMQRDQSMNFGFTAINPVALETVGYFDENYWPIYGEDVDYSYRCGLAGVRFGATGPTGVVHLGSQTVKQVPELAAQNQVTFPANEQYHIKKWNGSYNKETWSVPFNDPKFDLKIRAEDRRNPFPGYERADLDLMRT